MKKITKYLLLAALGMTLASCTNDELTEVIPQGLTTSGYELPFKATVADESLPASRVRYSDNTTGGTINTLIKKIDWVDGDQIMFYRKNGSADGETLKLLTKNTLTDGKITATNLYSENKLTWANSGNYSCQAIYPYSRVNSMDATTYEVTIPTEQTVGIGINTDSLLHDEWGKYWKWDDSSKKYVTTTKAEADNRKQFSACDNSSLLLRAKPSAISSTSTGPSGTTTFNFFTICRGFDITIDAPLKGKGLIKNITLEFYSDAELSTPYNVVGTFSGSNNTPEDDATENTVVLDFTSANSNEATKVLLQGTDRLVARAFISRAAHTGYSVSLQNKFIKVTVQCTLWDANGNSEDKTFYRTITTKTTSFATGANIDIAYFNNLPSLESGVNLGLTGTGNDILWGTENVNANVTGKGNTADPDGKYEQGTFYAWASTDDVAAFDLNTYKTLPLNAGAANKFYVGSTYKNPNGTGYANHKISNSVFDVAKLKVGGKWHMPTRAQLEALASQCTWSWDGEKYTATGTNGNTLTVWPGQNGSYGGTDAYLWSDEKENIGSTATEDDAYALHVSGGATPTATVELVKRFSGCLICPVRNK